jgi:small nuclear ribonucleoprotein D2
MDEAPPRKTARTEGFSKKESATADIDLEHGPFSVLQTAMTANQKVIVKCRFDKLLIGYVRAFDKHFNMLLSEVNEVCVNDSESQAQQRGIGSVVLRGDSVVYVVKLED